MRLAGARANLSIIFIIILAILLTLAGAVFYHSIALASRASKMEREQALEAAMLNFRADFSRVFFELITSFRPGLRNLPAEESDQALLAVYSDWHNNTDYPQLIDSISIGTIDEHGEAQFRRCDLKSGTRNFQPQGWPAGLEKYQQILQELRSAEELHRSIRPAISVPEINGNPVLVMPLGRELRSAALSPPPPPMAPPQQLSAFFFLELDLNLLQQQLIPALIERTFRGQESSEYELAIMAGGTTKTIYHTSNFFLPVNYSGYDGALMIFRPDERFFFLRAGPPPPPPPPPPPLHQKDHRIEPRRPAEGHIENHAELHLAGDNLAALSADGWHLVARHHGTPLETAIARARYLHLAIGFSLLILIFSSVTMLVVTAQRSHALARQQLEFVAGVSHELRTPLTVIQSAGFNLSSGRISDPARIQNYGSVIQKEGRRLANMIEQMLSYAGIQSGKKKYDFHPVSPRDIIEHALAEYDALFREAGWQVELMIDDRLPVINGDEQALESAVKNLFQNALKYADNGKWLRVAASLAEHRGQPELLITVADRGPGIAAEDLPYIFEPFYRGNKNASALAGAGLGLSLLKRHIQAHRGRIKVENQTNGGAIFKLFLPVEKQLNGASQ